MRSLFIMINNSIKYQPFCKYCLSATHRINILYMYNDKLYWFIICEIYMITNLSWNHIFSVQLKICKNAIAKVFQVKRRRRLHCVGMRVHVRDEVLVTHVENTTISLASCAANHKITINIFGILRWRKYSLYRPKVARFSKYGCKFAQNSSICLGTYQLQRVRPVTNAHVM